MYVQYKTIDIFAPSLCKKICVCNKKVAFMNVGQWSGVFYSPVNLDYRLQKKVLKTCKRNKVFFKQCYLFDDDFLLIL
jgi:hypothetical protein